MEKTREWLWSLKPYSQEYAEANEILMRNFGESLESIKERLVESPNEVESPSHYNTGTIEVIDYIEDQGLGFNLGNAVKYVSRAGKKDAIKTVVDLRKAVWYIEREIRKYEQRNNK